MSRSSTRLSTPTVSLKTYGFSLLWLVCLAFGAQLRAQQAVAFPSQVVGTAPATLDVGVTVRTAGQVAQIEVLTQGIAGLDFSLAPGGPCVSGASYNQGSTCVVQVGFAAMAPGPRRGAVILLGTSGAVLGEQQLFGIGQGPVAVFTQATITTVAGNGQWLYTGDSRPATQAPIFLPQGVAVDPHGDVYLSDSGNNRIRRVDGATQIISTVAGTGSAGSSGDNGPATSAAISNPSGMVIDGAGDLIFADAGNHAIRRLSLATGILSTIAGQPGTSGYSGDSGPATAALLNTPEDVALDNAGDIYIADTQNNVIRKIDTAGIITTVVGTGTAGFSGDGGLAISATLNTPWGLAVSPTGIVYVADLANNRVRAVSTAGVVNTVVGNGSTTLGQDGQTGPTTALFNPAAVALDAAGDLYVADSGHNTVRKLVVSTGVLNIVAGSTLATFSGDGGPAPQAGVYGPYAIALDSSGNVFIADIFHHRIREVATAQINLMYPPMRVGRTSAPQQATLENDGNAPLTLTAFNADQYSALSSQTTSCVLNSAMPSGTTCDLGVEFVPQVIGSSVTGTLGVTSNAANSPAQAILQGEVLTLDPTTTNLTISSNPAIYSQATTLTATVIGSASTQPVGTVRFYDGNSLLGSSTTSSSGVATLTLNTLSLGTHTLTANFTGDVTDAPSISAPALNAVVKQQPTVSLVAGSTTTKVGSPLALNITVSTPVLAATGAVSILDGNSVIGSATLSSNGTATWTTTSLAAGTHTLSASYAGDSNTVSGTSAALSQPVSRWSSTTTLTANTASSTIGSAVTYTVQVTPTSSVVPSGAVTLTDNGTPIATIALNNAGAGTYVETSTSVGPHTLAAAFAGDATNDASNSAPFTQTVQPVLTVTSLSTSADPAKAGATLVLAASVSSVGAAASVPAATGNVQFKDGGVLLGTAPISSTGAATLTLANLAIGNHPITATYVGDTDHSTSSSTALSQQIVLATTTVQLAASAAQLTYGRNLTLTAVVAGDGGVPTGVVSFLDGGTVIGSGQLNAAGQATLNIATLATGNHAITAQYAGDAKDNPSTSPAVNEAISQATTAIALASSNNPATAGLPLTILATLNSTGNIPSGSLVLNEGSTVLGTGVLDTTGIVRFTLSTLSAGQHTLTVSFAGDTGHAAAVSSPLAQTVNLATSAVALTTSGTPALVGSTVSLSAVVTGTGLPPTGMVQFADGSRVLGSVALNGAGVALFQTTSLALGTHTLVATYLGDTTHAPSAPAAIAETMQQTTITTLTASPNPVVVGAVVQMSATVVSPSGAIPTGTIRFQDGSALVGVAPVGANGVAALQANFSTSGTHALTAVYSGDTTDQASSSSALGEVVNLATTTVALSSNGSPATVGNAVLFTAVVSSQGTAPSGTVTLRDGATVLGSVRVTAAQAVFSINSLQAGSHSMSATYAGDSGTGTSTSPVLVQVEQQQTQTTLVTNAAAVMTVQPVTLTATVTGGAGATATVSFVDGQTVLGSSQVNAAGQATFTVPSLAAGSHSLTALFNGDSFHLPSTSPALGEQVSLRASTLSLTASSDSYLVGEQITLVAVVHADDVVNPTGLVTFSSGGVTLGTSSVSPSGAATLVFSPTANSYNVTASYAGDAVFSGSTSAGYSLNAGATSTFTVSSNPSTMDVASGDHQTLTLVMNSPASFADTLTFGCLDLPQYATCTFSKPEASLAAGGSATLQVVVDTGNPLGSGQAVSSAALSAPGKRSHGASSAYAVLPLSLLLTALLWRGRRGTALPRLMLLLLAVGAGMGLSGCAGTFNQGKTPAGTYAVRIMAIGKATGISRFATVTVTVK